MQRLTATTEHPVTVYYCKANLRTGLTVRILHRGRQIDTAGIRMSGPVEAEMIHGNSSGKPKRSGARCVLQVRRGTVETVDQPATLAAS